MASVVASILMRLPLGAEFSLPRSPELTVLNISTLERISSMALLTVSILVW
jgi:hypothetical protein